MPAIVSYQDLEVWKRSMQIVAGVYRLSKSFPPEERFGLTAQMRRCAVSIPSNIAEGYHRSTRRDYRHFVQHAFGSCAELETQVLIVKQLALVDEQTLQPIMEQVQIVMKMLNVLVHRLG